MRHGGATAFWFELKLEKDKIQFLLSDNGKGVKAGEWQTGFGLSSMQNRAKSFGGEVAFATDEGFELTITLPKDQ